MRAPRTPPCTPFIAPGTHGFGMPSPANVTSNAPESPLSMSFESGGLFAGQSSVKNGKVIQASQFALHIEQIYNWNDLPGLF